jgi:hypothetical protein
VAQARFGKASKGKDEEGASQEARDGGSRRGGRAETAAVVVDTVGSVFNLLFWMGDVAHHQQHHREHHGEVVVVAEAPRAAPPPSEEPPADEPPPAEPPPTDDGAAQPPPPAGPSPNEAFRPRGDAAQEEEAQGRPGGNHANRMVLGFELGTVNDGHSGVGGMALGALRWEGERWGLDARVQGMALPTDDGTLGTDQLGLWSAHVSFAPVAVERVRLRLGAGVDVARAPDVLMLGPGLSAGLDVCLVGELDFEARAQYTPLPFDRREVEAGLALTLGPFMLRGGLRTQLLDDRGVVDGVRHVDQLTGPYLGAALVFQ